MFSETVRKLVIPRRDCPIPICQNLGHSTTIEPLSMLSDRPKGVTTMVDPGGYEHRLYPGTERSALEHSNDRQGDAKASQGKVRRR